MTAPAITAEVHQAAVEHYRAGQCVLPSATDGTKRPAVGSWTHFRTTRPTREQMATWFGRTSDECHQQGLSLICGAVSGGLVGLDVEDQASWQALRRAALEMGSAELLQRVADGYVETAPKGGPHLLWHCSEPPRSQALARRLKSPEEQRDEADRVKMLIEVRGEGSLITVAPSGGAVHPSGRPWRLISGGVSTIVTLTPAEQAMILGLARALDRMPHPKPRPVHRRTQAEGDRPGDIFNARASWAEVLEPHGWVFVSQRGGEQFWRRPGAQTNGIDATTNYNDSGLLYVFWTSTEFEIERGYSKFAAFAFLTFDNDYEAAARDLAARGFESRMRYAVRAR